MVDRMLCNKVLIQFDQYCELLTKCKTKTQLREKLEELQETNNVWKKVTEEEEKRLYSFETFILLKLSTLKTIILTSFF